MQWGRFPGADSMVFAGGRLDDTVVALCGSGRHIVGAVPNVDPGRAYSQLPPLLDGLASDLENDLLVEAAEQPGADPLDRADRAALLFDAIVTESWSAADEEDPPPAGNIVDGLSIIGRRYAELLGLKLTEVVGSLGIQPKEAHD